MFAIFTQPCVFKTIIFSNEMTSHLLTINYVKLYTFIIQLQRIKNYTHALSMMIIY